MLMPFSTIIGTGSYLPPRRVTTVMLAAELAENGIETSDESLVSRSGTKGGHFPVRDLPCGDLATSAPRWIVRVDRRDAKQFACSLAIAAGNNRGVHVNEAAFLEKLVNGKREPAANPKDGAKKIRARTQMRNLAQKLRGVAFLLERVTIVRRAHDFDFVGHDFPALSFPLRRHQFSTDRNGSAGNEMLDRCIIGQAAPGDDLKVAQTGAIIQFDKRKVFRVPSRPHPSLHENLLDRSCAA